MCLLLLALLAPSLAAPRPAPLTLTHALPAFEQVGERGTGKVLTAYHIPVGVPEAARVAAAEAAALQDHLTSGGNDTGTAERPDAMIVGGLASYRGEHPFMAGLVISLTSGETSICGGSLITSYKVLTAAACYWDGYSQAYSIEVVLGSVTLFSGGARVPASTATLHAQYAPGGPHHNVALLTVPHQPATAYVKPISVAAGSEQFVGYRAEAIGYGRTADGAPITTSASLRDVFVDVISNAACAAYYGEAVVRAGEICSSGAGGGNPCGGDQGGPLVLYSSAGNDVLIGVFAFGSSAGCAAGAPAGYMRLSYYYPWILANV